MPSKWPEEIYDYDAKEVKHPDIESLDLDEGKWFKCKFCKNPKDRVCGGGGKGQAAILKKTKLFKNLGSM